MCFFSQSLSISPTDRFPKQSFRKKKHIYPFHQYVGSLQKKHMALGQNLVTLVNIKIAGKWVFTPLTLRIIGFDTHPYLSHLTTFPAMSWFPFFGTCEPPMLRPCRSGTAATAMVATWEEKIRGKKGLTAYLEVYIYIYIWGRHYP